ncbi:MAG: toll/interleukin-1 receptor domain-containing protein [Hyphomonadaceae bacterium]|nr:toll/interleukin-1 receptor domain-containing protein [Hyphomonadaceae bacterium]
MAEVFISYDRVAHDAAALIAVKLRQLKIDVWFDVRARPEEAQKAKVVLVCWTKAATSSELVRDEVAIGQRGQKLLGCYLEQVALSPPQTENLVNWNGQDDHPGWSRLLQRIGERLGRSDLAGGARAAAPPPFAERRPEPPRHEPPRHEPPRHEPPRHEPPRQEPQRHEPPPPFETRTSEPQGARAPGKRGADPWGDTWARRPNPGSERTAASPPPPPPPRASEPEGPPIVRTREDPEPAPEINGPGGLKISFGIEKPARGDGKRDRDADRDADRGRGRREEPRRGGEFSFSTPQASAKPTDWFTGSGEADAEPTTRDPDDAPRSDPKGTDFFAAAAAGYRDKERPKPRRRPPGRDGGGGGRVAMIIGALAVIGACVFGAAYFGTTYLTQGADFSLTDLVSSEKVPGADAGANAGEGGIDQGLAELASPPADRAAPAERAAPAAAPNPTRTAAAAVPRPGPAPVAAAPARSPVEARSGAGERDPVVDRLKTELRRLGLAVDGGEGVLGRRSTESVRALQAAIGVRATGRPSEALLRRASALESCRTERGGAREMSFRRPVSGAAESSSRAECCAAANLDARTNAGAAGLGYVRNWASACGNLGTTANAKLAGTIQGPARDNGTFTECQAAEADPAGAPGLFRCTVSGQVSCLYQGQGRERLVCE